MQRNNAKSNGYNNSPTNKKFTWKDEDKRYLLKNYSAQSISELAVSIGKTEKQIISQAARQYLSNK